MTWIRPDKQGCLIEIHAQPQARKNEIIGLHNERLKIKIQSPPVDGKANEMLIEFLAETLKVSRSRLRLTKGETSRQKQVLVEGMTPAEVEPLLLKRGTS
jgi:uncharacterized protein (TIGR00251 family)